MLVFGLGGSSTALAQETQNRLFRYGVVVSAHSDPYVMKMTASTLKPERRGDRHFRAPAARARWSRRWRWRRHYRAKAIAITAPDIGPRRATADLALTVDVPEFPDPLKPTASRYAFLAIIDLVSTAVGYRLDPRCARDAAAHQVHRAEPSQGQGARAAWRLSFTGVYASD